MSGQRTIEGWQLRLRPHGGGRYLGAVFLAIWLCGWAAAEAFAIWFLVRGALALLAGTPPGAGREPLSLAVALVGGAFLILWLALWTLGGVAAFHEFLRLLCGEDVTTVTPAGLEVRWLRGPIRTVRRFERHQIRGISLVGWDDRLSLETSRERLELSRLGTRQERIEGASGLRAELALPVALQVSAIQLPWGWEELITPEGERAVTPDRATRAKQARFMGVVAMALATLTFAIARGVPQRLDLVIPTAFLLVLALAAAAGGIWLARGRWEWRMGSGRLTLRRRFGSGVRDVFEGRRLVLESSSDSDGDSWFELHASANAEKSPLPTTLGWRTSAPRNSRSVTRVMNDPSIVRDLALWLSRETGLELDDHTTPEARDAELAALRATLANSGRFGAWAAKALDKLANERKRAG